MQIDAVVLDRVQIPLKARVEHARSERRTTDAVVVTLRSTEGLSGYGEILPRPYVTGESVERSLHEIAPGLARTLLDRQFGDKEEVMSWLWSALDATGKNLATFSGFELALLDLAGRTFDFPAGEVLGNDPQAPLPPGVVIGFETPTDKLARHCAVLRLRNRRHIKMKVGLRDDEKRIGIVCNVLGPGIPLRLDANGAWTPDEAVTHLRALHAYPIASIEQPVAAHDFAGLRRVRNETGVAVMADESVCTIEEADRLIDEGAVDIFNVRLGKCGGLLGSLRIVERARDGGLECNLGTLVGETGILSRASELFGRFVSGFPCLDGKGQNRSLLEADLLETSAQDTDPLTPGLGVVISEPRLRSYRIERVLLGREEARSER